MQSHIVIWLNGDYSTFWVIDRRISTETDYQLFVFVSYDSSFIISKLGLIIVL